MNEIIFTLFSFFIEKMDIFLGVLFLFVTFLYLIIALTLRPESSLMVAFEYLYEQVYRFYEEILGTQEKSAVKGYVVTLFFVILFANIFSVISDFIAPIFGKSSSGELLLSQYITLPTTSLEFTLALSCFSVILMLYIQARSYGIKDFFLNYIPFTGKKYFVLDRSSLSAGKYMIFAPLVKLVDILLSCFLALLDILGLFAKIISLSFRLFGNMTSGTVLLSMVILGSSSLTALLTGYFGGYEIPIILPVLVMLQGLLVAGVQAMVFALLVAIFIRIAQLEVGVQ